MTLPLFDLEVYLEPREFKAQYMLCGSDVETYGMHELLAMADSESQALWQQLRLGYTETAGLPLLRAEIAKLYAGALSAQNILCFAGAEEGIYTVLCSLLQAHDHIITFSPCYQSLDSVAVSICDVTRIALRETEHWRIDLDAVRSALQPNTRMIIINTPHNPTGSLIDHATQQALVELARTRGIWLFSDEVYRGLECTEAQCLPPIVNLYEKGISLGVMSKAYGLPGLRIGWIATQDKTVLQHAANFKHYLSICNSGPSEILALIALRNRALILERSREIIRQNFLRLETFIEKHSGILRWQKPQGGCVGLLKLRLPQSASVVAEQLLQREGVLLLPGSVFQLPDDCFRIGYGRLTFQEGLERFSKFIDQLDIH